MLRVADLADTDRVIVPTKSTLTDAARIFAATPLATIQAWQAFHLVDSAAPYLSRRFVSARFEFRNHTLAGQPEMQPRWKRGVAFVNGAVGELVGKEYVAAYFPPSSKAKMEGLVKELITALSGRIAQLDWMSPATKAKAQEKLSQLTVKIGYPVKWKTYAELSLKSDDLYGNVERSDNHDWEYDVHRLHGPVDKQEWAMTPQTVNAYYNSVNNEIVFPAAILQPPLFDPSADMAVNYGGIGGVIGHEMTHGFDDQGRKSDGHGMLKDWWTAEDAAKFKAQADKLGAQYSQFEPVKGFHVNGQLTMGENIADLGGLLLAIDAYHASLHGQPAPVIDGLTGDQRVFLGWAQAWRQKIRDAAAVQYTKMDPHSPPHFRVNGTVRNNPAWYDAFGIKPGDPMYLAPTDRVHIW
jgi:putative endopeptidase